ncbi:unnamed protein product [Rhizophagus irregularis]|nr:unnamed protein product [Rhizophagus irregularis]
MLSPVNLPGEEISKRKSQEIEERIRQEKEKMEKMREFKAQPLPTGSPDCLPTRPYYPPTHPKPFALLTNDRGEKYQREFYEKVRKEQEYYKENRFHAQPLPNFEPEIPRKPECPPPTEPIGSLGTKNSKDQGGRSTQCADLVHHAQPIRYYTPINIQPSDKKTDKTNFSHDR